MADLGFRENVMGPQPIAHRKPVPQDMLDTVQRFLDLLADGNGAELAAMATESARDEAAGLAASVKAGSYNDRRVLATARVSEHYWVKAKMTGPGTKPFVVQLRVGMDGGQWRVWETMNLTDARSAWSK